MNSVATYRFNTHVFTDRVQMVQKCRTTCSSSSIPVVPAVVLDLDNLRMMSIDNMRPRFLVFTSRKDWDGVGWMCMPQRLRSAWITCSSRMERYRIGFNIRRRTNEWDNRLIFEFF